MFPAFKLQSNHIILRGYQCPTVGQYHLKSCKQPYIVAVTLRLKLTILLCVNYAADHTGLQHCKFTFNNNQKGFPTDTFFFNKKIREYFTTRLHFQNQLHNSIVSLRRIRNSSDTILRVAVTSGFVYQCRAVESASGFPCR